MLQDLTAERPYFKGTGVGRQKAGEKAVKSHQEKSPAILWKSSFMQIRPCSTYTEGGFPYGKVQQ